MRLGVLATLGLATALTAGCNTAVGNYFANRGRDFGECFRFQSGVGFGVGVSADAAGALHVGLAVAVVPRVAGFGWVYGEGYAFGQGATGLLFDTEADWSALPFMVAPFTIVRAYAKAAPPPGEAPRVYASVGGSPGHQRHPFTYDRPFAFHWRQEAVTEPDLGLRHATHWDLMALPALLSWVPVRGGRRAMLWTERALAENPRAHLHAFDIEASAYAGFVFARVGFSPGEFLDFLLGWFGLDIAGDDRELPEPGR
jgi:hypothetical protein